MDRDDRLVRPSGPSMLLMCLLSLALLTARTLTGQAAQEYQKTDPNQQLYRIDVEDSTEAGLVEQQLKIKPLFVRNREFYYYGNEEITELVRRYGYQPVRVDREDVLTRLVMVRRDARSETDLAKAGVSVVLRERDYWVVRGTLRQVQPVERLGFSVQELGRREPRPRQVRIKAGTGR